VPPKDENNYFFTPTGRRCAADGTGRPPENTAPHPFRAKTVALTCQTVVAEVKMLESCQVPELPWYRTFANEEGVVKGARKQRR